MGLPGAQSVVVCVLSLLVVLSLFLFQLGVWTPLKPFKTLPNMIIFPITVSVVHHSHCTVSSSDGHLFQLFYLLPPSPTLGPRPLLHSVNVAVPNTPTKPHNTQTQTQMTILNSREEVNYCFFCPTPGASKDEEGEFTSLSHFLILHLQHTNKLLTEHLYT